MVGNLQMGVFAFSRFAVMLRNDKDISNDVAAKATYHQSINDHHAGNNKDGNNKDG
jgi:hypothetical protein